MGLLDDAIKEHLELKRRRGADPTEIAREEAEALGPVRREAADPPAQDAEFAPEPAALDEPGAAYGEPLEPRAYEHDHDAAQPPPAPDPEADRLRLDDAPQVHDEPYAEPEEESVSPPHGDPLAHQATREFSSLELDDAHGAHEDERAQAPASDVVPADDEGEPEDVLEETPEFLQETPEHDRLWFEQKPPKDFDF